MVFQFNQRKVIHGARKDKLGTVQVSIELPENDQDCEPDKMLPMDVDIRHCCRGGGKLSFDEVQVRLNEVRAYTCIEKAGRRRKFNSETDKLVKKMVRCKNQSKSGPNGILKLKQLQLDIPKTALVDGNAHGVHVHHYVEITLMSTGRFVENLKFLFPIKLGGKQYKSSPDNHPVYFNKSRSGRLRVTVDSPSATNKENSKLSLRKSFNDGDGSRRFSIMKVQSQRRPLVQSI